MSLDPRLSDRFGVSRWNSSAGSERLTCNRLHIGRLTGGGHAKVGNYGALLEVGAVDRMRYGGGRRLRVFR